MTKSYKIVIVIKNEIENHKSIIIENIWLWLKNIKKK